MNSFVAQLEQWRLDLDEGSIEALSTYARCLAEYERANVIGTRDYGQILREHVLDCLSCFLFGPLLGAEGVVDVGAGGGLPGIPLRLVRPELKLTLVEATGKKVRFLQTVAKKMSLGDVEIVQGRAEELGKNPDYREKYDIATARALAPLPELAEYCVPLIKKGGYVVAMKARPGREEIEVGAEAASRLGAEISEEIDVEFLPEVSEKKRTLIIMTKTSSTPEKYPRRIGVPKKSPLGVK